MKSVKSLLSENKMVAPCLIESSSILLVNDHPSWLEAARTILDSHEFIISSADSLESAQEMARALPPDLIVSDLAISGMSCADICRRLKAEPCLTDVPILLITSPSGDDQSLIEGMEAGADDCLHITASGVLIRKKAERLISQFKEKRASESLSDIAEHNFVEKELRSGDERFRLLLENSSEVISIIGTDGGVRYQSPSIKQVLGYEPEEMIGKSAFALVHPDDQQKAAETLSIACDSRRFASAIELRFIHKDGTERILETVANNFLDEPVVAGIAINLRDITDRKNAEEAWRLTQLSIDRSADAVYRIGKDGKFLYVNDSACRMVGYTRKEMLSMHLCEIDVIFIAENWPETWETTKRRETFTFESRQRNKRGKIFPVEVSASYLEFNGKECICAFVRDITERKIMERALRQSEREYRNLFENATDTMVVFDPETGIILEANSRACEMYGLTKDELLGVSLKVIAKDVEGGEERVREILTHGGIKNFETVHFKKDGTPIDLLENSSLIEYAGRTSIVSTFREVTQIKRLQQQLVQSEKLAALGQLVSGVAHELNNPLTSVIGYTQLALAGSTLDHQIRERLDIVSREAERTRRIVQNLLSFSRQHKPSRTSVCLNDLLERTLELRTYGMRVNNIKVNRELGAIPMVMADGHQLQQVFLNIVVNAEQAISSCERSGTLTVKSRVKQVDGSDWIEIQIADDGPGIQTENISKIFDPFFTTKPVGKGTGLGLSISYGIMKEHGGAIRAENTDCGGATFIIELPA